MTASLTTAQACEQLSVKPATLYAYVSRGLIRSVPGPGGTRQRRYDAGATLVGRRIGHGCTLDIEVDSIESVTVDDLSICGKERGIVGAGVGQLTAGGAAEGDDDSSAATGERTNGVGEVTRSANPVGAVSAPGWYAGLRRILYDKGSKIGRAHV